MTYRKVFIIAHVLLINFELHTTINVSHNTSDWFSNTTCAIRYQKIDFYKKLIDCNEVRKLNSLCARNITVGYTELVPYVYTDYDGKVTGMLPDMLNEILINACCLGCNQLTYAKKLTKEINGSFHIYIPVENAINSNSYFGYPYSMLLQFRYISIIGKKDQPTSIDTTLRIFKSMAEAWPLYLIAITMAICAGVVMWIVDTWINKTEFPRSFIRGSFEGFWWAFVSMTTVGYGDRSPRSAIGRIIAVLWILLGITIFNLLSSTIVSSMTSELTAAGDNTIFNKTVGITESMIAPYTGLVDTYAKYEVYANLTELKEALRKDKVRAIALEATMAAYFMDELQDIQKDIGILKELSIHKSSMGLIADQQIVTLINSFLKHNTDGLDIIRARAFNAILSEKNKIAKIEEDNTVEVPSPNNVLYRTIGISLAFAIVSLLFGNLLVLWKRRSKQKSNEEEDVDTNNNL